MQYVGILTQQRRNNQLSALLLILFPLIIVGILLLFYTIIDYVQYQDISNQSVSWARIAPQFWSTLPWVAFFVVIWFTIAYFTNVSMIRHATGARPLERKENPQIYNMVENLCIATGMNMPQINVIDDPMLNAFASGIDEKTYTVTLTTGIINHLEPDELEGVIAHELTHIRNRDTRLLIVSIIFVGILAALSGVIWRMAYYSMWMNSGRRSEKKENGIAVVGVMVVALICVGIGYFFTMLTRFAISRKREFMADAGGAEMTRNPQALASALRKISGNPGLTDTKREVVARLFIHHSNLKGGAFSSLFSTHPDIEERIRILEQF